MNIIDFILIALIGYSLLAGMHKGFIASGLALFGFVAAWFGAYFSYSALMNVALSNPTIMGFCSGLLEPDSFFNGVDATQLVSGVANSDAFKSIGDYIVEKVPLIGNAFVNNVNTQAFAGQAFGASELKTLADYFDQTVWTAIFGVVSFIIMFAIIYVVATLLVNLLHSVLAFPTLRKVDRLIGGIFGVLRGAVVAVMVYVIADYVLKMFLLDSATGKGALDLINNSKMLTFARGISFLDVQGMFGKLIGN